MSVNRYVRFTQKVTILLVAAMYKKGAAKQSGFNNTTGKNKD